VSARIGRGPVRLRDIMPVPQMSLSTDNRLGPYEILDRLGEGGMGEVYRARDARLGRDVAVKVLPASVAGDPDRRVRRRSSRGIVV
jgi:serine/threonine protein kinase